MKIKKSAFCLFKLEPIIVAKINQCDDEKINKIIALGFFDLDHYGYLSDKESIKSYIECYADTKEMKTIMHIINQ